MHSLHRRTVQLVAVAVALTAGSASAQNVAPIILGQPGRVAPTTPIAQSQVNTAYLNSFSYVNPYAMPAANPFAHSPFGGSVPFIPTFTNANPAFVNPAAFNPAFANPVAFNRPVPNNPVAFNPGFANPLVLNMALTRSTAVNPFGARQTGYISIPPATISPFSGSATNSSPDLQIKPSTDVPTLSTGPTLLSGQTMGLPAAPAQPTPAGAGPTGATFYNPETGVVTRLNTAAFLPWIW